ncbi:MAG TPA: hypothetical protein VKI43_00960 [Vicinamibacterales bacterium]|nr:hypothetical protein [Vicinamibacterales bacterium]
MISARRLLAIVCIVVILVTGMMPAGAALLRGVLVPLGPLFGTIVSSPLPDIARTELVAAPALSVRASRAPPLA